MTLATPIFAGNWKMNHGLSAARSFIEEITGQLPQADRVDTIICAPFIDLPYLVEAAQDQPVQIGAQNMHFAKKGAYTGEVSPSMLQELGVDYVIIGHSERRQYFNETDESVNLKALAAHEHGLTPIICVGEHLEEREEDRTKEVVQNQVVKALTNLSSEQVSASVIAYEPIWAIGTGKTATPEDANDVIMFIRSVVEDQYDQQVAANIRIQYGGSVKPETIADLMAQSDVDGALVGGASVKSESFIQLLEGYRS
jgi:triosephosphate isomerase (TIM)